MNGAPLAATVSKANTQLQNVLNTGSESWRANLPMVKTVPGQPGDPRLASGQAVVSRAITCPAGRGPPGSTARGSAPPR